MNSKLCQVNTERHAYRAIVLESVKSNESNQISQLRSGENARPLCLAADEIVARASVTLLQQAWYLERVAETPSISNF